jgi:hypothetical protein
LKPDFWAQAMEDPDEPSIYERASVVFGAIIVGFAVWAGIEVVVDGDGVTSGAFLICVVFALLGAGRVYLGLKPR